ncbi:zf-HC2 domain-containing protein [Lysinibacillus pakistanensis]
MAPAYIDKLTSEETNEQIEKHMDQCEECQII